MQIKNCEFPDDLYYAVENDIWVKHLGESENLIGLTPILSGIAGRINAVRFRRNITMVKIGESIGTLESSKFFGAIRSPINGKVLEFNSKVEQEPRLINSFPYSEGWIAKIESLEGSYPNELLPTKDAVSGLETRINELHVRCFKKFPDEELVAIGTECLATLVDLGEILKVKPAGTVVHIVSDDPLAGIELERWADITKNEIVETRDEGNLHHFLVEKKMP